MQQGETVSSHKAEDQISGKEINEETAEAAGQLLQRPTDEIQWVYSHIAKTMVKEPYWHANDLHEMIHAC
jgi:hypothetical protein